MPLPDLSGLTLGHEEAATQMGIAQASAAARWAERARRRDQPNGPVDEKADRARAASVRVQEGDLELADERRKSRPRYQATEQRYKEILDASERQRNAEQANAEQMREEILDALERRHNAEQANAEKMREEILEASERRRKAEQEAAEQKRQEILEASELRHMAEQAAAEKMRQEILEASERRHKAEQAAAEQMHREILEASKRRHKAEQDAIAEQRGVDGMAYENAEDQRKVVKKKYSAQKQGTSKRSPERDRLKAEALAKLRQIEDDLNTLLDLFELPLAKSLEGIRINYENALAQAKANFDRAMKEVRTQGS